MSALENLLAEVLSSDLKGKEHLAEVLRAVLEFRRSAKGPRSREVEARLSLLEAVDRAPQDLA